MIYKFDDNILNNIIKIIDRSNFLNLYSSSNLIKNIIYKYFMMYKYLHNFSYNYTINSIIKNISNKYTYLFGINNLKKCKLIKWQDTFRSTDNILPNYINNIPLSIFDNNHRICIGLDDFENIFITFVINKYVYTISNIQKYKESTSRLCVNNIDAYYNIVNGDINLRNHPYDCGCNNLLIIVNLF